VCFISGVACQRRIRLWSPPLLQAICTAVTSFALDYASSGPSERPENDTGQLHRERIQSKVRELARANINCCQGSCKGAPLEGIAPKSFRPHCSKAARTVCIAAAAFGVLVNLHFRQSGIPVSAPRRRLRGSELFPSSPLWESTPLVSARARLARLADRGVQHVCEM